MSTDSDWDQPTLFDQPAHTPLPEMNADRKRKLLNDAKLDEGIHPATGLPLLPDRDKRCKDCVYLFRVRSRYYKCEKSHVTNGAATDVRVSWPACKLYKEIEYF